MAVNIYSTPLASANLMALQFFISPLGIPMRKLAKYIIFLIDYYVTCAVEDIHLSTLYNKEPRIYIKGDGVIVRSIREKSMEMRNTINLRVYLKNEF